MTNLPEEEDAALMNVADFLAADMKRGIIPSTFLPLQSGVGNIANAVLGALGRDKTLPAFEMYTAVIQNSVIGLIREGRIDGYKRQLCSLACAYNHHPRCKRVQRAGMADL